MAFMGRRGRDRMTVVIYNYLCYQCLSPLQVWVRTSFVARCTRCNIMWQVGGFLRVLRIPPPIKLTVTM